MPLPRFIPGEVLSAVKLNQMVAIFNRTQNSLLSMSLAFERVEANDKNMAWDGEAVWTWMFRYNPTHPHYKLRYSWMNRSEDAFANATVAGVPYKWSDPATGTSTGGLGTFYQNVDLSTMGLQAGKVYTYQITARRDHSLFFRVDYLFMTNNLAYAPAILG